MSRYFKEISFQQRVTPSLLERGQGGEVVGSCPARRRGTGLPAVATHRTFHFGLQQCLHPLPASPAHVNGKNQKQEKLILRLHTNLSRKIKL